MDTDALLGTVLMRGDVVRAAPAGQARTGARGGGRSR